MNKVMLIGNVGKEPDVRYYAADQCVAHVRLATTERGYTLPNGTQVPDRTDWHSLTFSRGLAKVVERYVHTGDKLYVEGRLRYSNIEDKRGQRQMVTDILVDNMELLSPKKDNKASVSANGNTAADNTGNSAANVQAGTASAAPDANNNIPF